jgi:hypothetical protein
MIERLVVSGGVFQPALRLGAAGLEILMGSAESL